MQKKKIISIVVTFVLSLVFLVTSLGDYGPGFELIYQLTFLSNFFTGIFLLVVGFLLIFDKKIPQLLFLDAANLLLLVFIVSLVMNYSFTGFTLFLHGINPALMLLYYMIFSNQTNTKWYQVFTVLIVPALFMVFAFIFGSITGNYIYDFLNFALYGTANSLIFLLIAFIGLNVLGFGFLYLNKLMYKRKNKY